MTGINLTFMLQEVVDLRDKRVGTLVTERLPASAPGQAFLELLGESADVFEQVRHRLLEKHVCLQKALTVRHSRLGNQHRGKKCTHCAHDQPACCLASAALSVQIYCMAFQLLEREWLAMRASYMDFPSVMKRVQQNLERALSSQPASLLQLQRLLDLQ